MRSGFPGFPEEGLAFFRGLEKNNTREWFQERKPVFDEKVKTPMAAFVNELNSRMAAFAPAYITDPGKAIYRIYRDTRFAPDKTPYKTHIGATFTRHGLEKHAGAGLYCSVSHKEIEVAGGVFMPGPRELLAIRTHIGGHHEEFRKILNNRKLRSLVGELWGAQLTRVPKGFGAEHPAADLIRYKQWLVYTVLNPALALTPKLLGAVVTRFRAMMPLVEFLNAPLGRGRGAAELLF